MAIDSKCTVNGEKYRVFDNDSTGIDDNINIREKVSEKPAFIFLLFFAIVRLFVASCW